jgi:predicted MFS family arabinose efflux permease
VDVSQDAPARLRGIGEGLSWLWRHRFFRTSALLFAAGNPLYIGLYLLAILVAKHNGASSGEIGAMLALVGCGGLVGALAAGSLRDALRPRTALVGEAWLLACVLPLLFVAHSALLIGLIVGVCEMPTPLANSLVSGYRVALTPDRLRGRVQAAGTLVTMSLGWLGPLAVGVVFQRVGANATVLMMVGWALLLAAATTFAPGLHSGPPALSAAPAEIAPTADARP